MATPAQKKLAQKRLADIREAKNARFKWLKWTGFTGKTFWDWLQLLIIPVVLAGGGYLFGTWQHDVDQQQALDQQRAIILQTYIDNIQDMLLHDNLLKSSSFDANNPYYDVAVSARARTLTALRGLDPQRKGILLQFLYEVRLIGFSDVVPVKNTKKLIYTIYPAIIRLTGANLSGIIMASTESSVFMAGVDLTSTNMRGANLSGSIFDEAQMFNVHLEGANLSNTILWDAELDGHLNGTNLEGADLEGANLHTTDLSRANLSHSLLDCFDSSGSTLPPSRCTSLNETDITQQQLDQASSCEGAILPQGLTCHQNH